MIADHYFTSGGYFTSHSVFLLYNQSNLSVISFTQQTDKLELRLSALVSTLNLVCDAPVRQHHRFPRGEAVERSETDEERRDGTISYAVRKKGTI